MTKTEKAKAILDQVVLDEYQRVHAGEESCDVEEFERRIRALLPNAIGIMNAVNRDQRRTILSRAKRKQSKIEVVPE